MKIRFPALLAVSVLCCLNAANVPKAPLAIYYSFDAIPPAAVFTAMQSELGRILAPAGLRVTWRSTDAPRDSGEDFPGIVVFRFHGRCSFEGARRGEGLGPDPAGLPLAGTQLTDGHVLPFGQLDCDVVRRFIASAAKSLDTEDKNAALGRALARVGAHEIYHMLTGSETHASQGIARSAHSRADLTAPSFTFAKAETNWLRTWVEKQLQPLPGLQSKETQTPSVSSISSGPESTEPEPATFAGR
jgi:hypothetical protein